MQLTPEPKTPAREEQCPRTQRNMSQEPKSAWQAPLHSAAPTQLQAGWMHTDEPVHLLLSLSSSVLPSLFSLVLTSLSFLVLHFLRLRHKDDICSRVSKLWQAPHCWCIAKIHTRYGVFLQDLRRSPKPAVTLKPGKLQQMGLIRCGKPYRLATLSLTSLLPTAHNFIHNPYFTDLPCETWSFNKQVFLTSY